MYLSLFTTLFLALAAQSAPLPKSAQASLAPLYRRSENPTRFIVALHPNSVNPTNRLTWLNTVLGSSSVSAQSVGDDGGVVHHWDENVFNGFAGSFDQDSLTTLRAQSEVAYVEEDVVLHKTATAAVTQTNSPWGIARLSSSTPLSVARNFDPSNVTFSYTFPTTAGSNVDIYILDSGIRTTHSDFGGRATFLATFNGGVQGDDRDGHGTHVAGTAGGSFFGVAKKSNLFAVKVLDDQGAGPISGIISGLNLVAQRVANQTSPSTNDTGIRPIFQSVESPAQVSNQTANANNFTLLNQLPTTLNSSTPLDPTASRAVVNMSLGGDSHSNALDAAVQSLVAQNVVVVIAAGNSGVTVGTSSPADVDTAIVVGAMDVHDTVPSFSDFGSNVAVFAPGVDIISCGITSDSATQVLSGTSMATPHITGLSALILGDDPTLTPAEVKAKIQSLALRNALGSGFPTGTGTSNLLAQNGLSL